MKALERRIFDVIAQVKRQPSLRQDAHHAHRGPSQAERILVAGRHLADREEAAQGVELVGERDGARNRILRQPIAGEARPVVRLDGVGDLARLAVVQRIVAPHDALQLGELADHAGEKVGLRKPRGTLRHDRIGLEFTCNPSGKQLQALHALELRAELAVIDDARKLGNPRLEARLAVLQIEEARVFKPGPDHALVAAHDVARIRDAHVRHDEELRLQAPGRVEQRKILLILPHGEDKTLLRHFQVGGVEPRGVDAGVLDERGDLVEEIGVLAERAALARRRFPELALDLGSARRKIGHDHAVGGETLLVLAPLA